VFDHNGISLRVSEEREEFPAAVIDAGTDLFDNAAYLIATSGTIVL
jgi:hypothetical protein